MTDQSRQYERTDHEGNERNETERDPSRPHRDDEHRDAHEPDESRDQEQPP